MIHYVLVWKFLIERLLNIISKTRRIRDEKNQIFEEYFGEKKQFYHLKKCLEQRFAPLYNGQPLSRYIKWIVSMHKTYYSYRYFLKTSLKIFLIDGFRLLQF